MRRLLTYEVLVVMAVFPLPFVVNAVAALVNSIVNPKEVEHRFPIVITGHEGLSLPFVVMLFVVQLAAPALVLYLLTRSGEGAESIGLTLDSSRIRGDAALILPVFAAAYLGPLLVLQVILQDLGVHGYSPTTTGAPPSYAIAVLVAGLQAGVVEEIVVLGYLVRRLEQLGFKSGPLLAIAVAVRVSYHVYYGLSVIAFAVWAAVSVIIYRRYRRLWPFIVVHVLWDCIVGLSALYGGWVIIASALILFPATATFTALWWNSLERGA
jgi:membrane protease YdiL (CAAX protease family)